MAIFSRSAAVVSAECVVEGLRMGISHREGDIENTRGRFVQKVTSSAEAQAFDVGMDGAAETESKAARDVVVADAADSFQVLHIELRDEGVPVDVAQD
jgi:hypothetical protein